ncbi:MAG: NAD-dependent DNA ligase LigA [Patescibacteria group bacterium]
MTRAEAVTRIKKLRRVIDHQRYLYHVLDRQELSAAALDSLKHELQQLEDEYPELITPDSPTQRVGGKPLPAFRKVSHSQRMLSLVDAFSEEEMKEWQERILKLLPVGSQPQYYGEIKMDGLAVTLIYRGGRFTQGATRGDGRIGEDVTQNLKTIEAIPLNLQLAELPPARRKKAGSEVEIRGEVYMSKTIFNQLNRRQEKAGETVFANPRNAAAGSIRQLDSKVTARRFLSFYAYDLVTDLGQQRHSEGHELIKKMGLPTNPNNEICRDLSAVNEYYRKIGQQRGHYNYWTDGIVVNIDDIGQFKRLGVVGKAPRGSIAYKYAAEQATTTVEDIIAQVGRTGAITPVAVLRPVKVAGSIVSRATLHNQDEIDRLAVRIGDTVVVQKAGDIIPDIVKVIERLRPAQTKKYKLPGKCPFCHSPVTRLTDEVNHYCTNNKCFGQLKEQFRHFVSKRAFDIDGLGPQLVDQLLQAGLLRKPADIFKLDKVKLQNLPGWAEKKAANLITAIEKSKAISLPRFIIALGIRHVGEETANDLAHRFGTIDKIMLADKKDFNSVPDIGEVVADSLSKYFNIDENKKRIKELLDNGVMIDEPVAQSQSLNGRTYVLTGSLTSMTRDEAKAAIRQRGGKVSSGVSRETTAVIAGDEPGSKYDKAKKLGITVISEGQFKALLK